MSDIARFPVAEGLSIVYRDVPAEGAETGPPVVCMHGLTRNHQDFDELAPRLSAIGRRVIIPTVRGRGASDYDPEPLRYQPMTYSGDILALLAYLKIDKAVAVGTSMGGLMAMIMAALKPGIWAGVVLNDVGPELDPRGIARIAGYVGKNGPFADWAEAEAACKAIGEVAFPDAPGNFWGGFARRTCRQEPDGSVRLDYDPAIAQAFVQADGAAPPDLWALYAALGAAPLLIVRGALSDLLAPETVARMKERHPGATSVDVPRVGHAPFLTEKTAWDALSGFLARL
jgi:pimeloyl-ACP methyl ester carboxylesterase